MKKYIITEEELLDFLEYKIKNKIFQKTSNYNDIMSNYLLEEWANNFRDIVKDALSYYQTFEEKEN